MVWKPLKVFLGFKKQSLGREEREVLLHGAEPPKLWCGLGERGSFQIQKERDVPCLEKMGERVGRSHPGLLRAPRKVQSSAVLWLSM